MPLPVQTAVGVFLAHYSGRGLAGLDFPNRRSSQNRSGKAEESSPQIRRWHALTIKALNETLAGHVPAELPPLDLAAGTEFQQRVWRALMRIGPGKTKSYGQIAADIGRPKASRAVGAACGANPIPVLIPCHRVLAANQRLGGFSSGLDWKRKLLAGEGVLLFE